MQFDLPENTHRLLKRQIKKSLENEAINENERLSAFINLINDSYFFVDDERNLYRRSDEISSRELMEVNDQLQAKNDFLDSFNHGMAHDIKNHTSNLQGLITMLRKYATHDNSEMRDQIIERLDLSVNQMVSIVQGFLYLSRAEGKIDSQYKIVSSEEIKTAIHLETQYLFSGRDYELDYSFQLNDLFYSKHIIKIILVNLISNAIKFTPTTRKSIIKVSVTHDKNELKLTVEDNGMGMDLNDPKNKIFSLFNRSEEGEKTKGFGVGLFVIKKIIETNSGDIQILSTPDVGSTFTIKLPLIPKN
ncbi:MAG: HAMP domain-containing histidine kinase [Salibacteraceae bacterium]|nr:HAMP domain-containing histidine kinase [Salibacteraceae bacterium]